jgi:hypothetical protein
LSNPLADGKIHHEDGPAILLLIIIPRMSARDFSTGANSKLSFCAFSLSTIQITSSPSTFRSPTLPSDIWGFLIQEGEMWRCHVRYDEAGRLLHPTELAIPSPDQIDDDSNAKDDLDQVLFVDECVSLLYHV